MRYAAGTTVSAERSKAEIEETVRRYGATNFVSGWDHKMAVIGFSMAGRMVKFHLPMPDRTEDRFVWKPRADNLRWRKRTDSEIEKELNQEIRQRWRALTLVIKAKLEAVESGITTFEEEFLAHVVLPDGSTVGDWASPQISQCYESGKMPPLLPGIGGTGG